MSRSNTEPCEHGYPPTVSCTQCVIADLQSRLGEETSYLDAARAVIDRLRNENAELLTRLDTLFNSYRERTIERNQRDVRCRICRGMWAPSHVKELHEDWCPNNLPAGGTANTGSVAGPITVRRTSNPAAGPDGADHESPQQSAVVEIHGFLGGLGGMCQHCGEPEHSGHHKFWPTPFVDEQIGADIRAEDIESYAYPPRHRRRYKQSGLDKLAAAGIAIESE